MKRIYSTLLIVLSLLMTTAVGAQSDSKESASLPTPEAAPPVGHASSKEVIAGQVTKTMVAGRYTYVEVDTGEERVWGAGPHVEVKVGYYVYFPSNMPMVDFKSESLGRTFDLLYMADAIRVTSSQAPSRGLGEEDRKEATDSEVLEPVAGGYTVAQIFEQRADLSGQEVAIRGRVAKFNGGIMGMNWIHLQDGTVGPNNANDLVVTSDTAAKVGSIVTVRGIVVTDKDFGSGYSFDVLIEKASVKTE